MRWPYKVTTLKADGSTIEVYSVPLGDDPYSYARHMHERDKIRGPIAAFHIGSDNVERKLSLAELVAHKSPAR